MLRSGQIPITGVDPCQPIPVHISGIANNCNREKAEFLIDAEQYISLFKDIDPKKASPLTPFRYTFPDTPRFRNKKPLPPTNTQYLSMDLLRALLSRQVDLKMQSSDSTSQSRISNLWEGQQEISIPTHQNIIVCISPLVVASYPDIVIPLKI
jgi:hypothetical protein